MFPIGANSNHSPNDDVETWYIQKRKNKPVFVYSSQWLVRNTI
jgi:hypothetical protein